MDLTDEQLEKYRRQGAGLLVSAYERLLKSPRKGKWVKINKELPPMGEPVLCKKKDGSKIVSWRCYEERNPGNKAYFFHEAELYKGGLVLEWMYLPE